MKHALEATRAVDYKLLGISSPAFRNQRLIPDKYTCDGLNISPPLDIKNIPADARCLALVMEDMDAPAGIRTHWVVWNIPVTHHIKEGRIAGIQGINDFGTHVYEGPCPRSGRRRYVFKVYALNNLAELYSNAGKHQLERAMSEYVIGYGELTGVYGRG